MFGIRTFFKNHFGAIVSAFNWITSQANQEKVAKEIGTAMSLAQVAEPFVKNIAQLAAGDKGAAAVGEVEAAANKIGISVEDFLNETDPHRKAGLALDLGGEALRQKLIALMPTLDHGLEINGEAVTTAEQLEALPSSALQTVAQIAVRAGKITGEIGTLIKTTVEGDAAPATATATAPQPADTAPLPVPDPQPSDPELAPPPQ